MEHFVSTAQCCGFAAQPVELLPALPLQSAHVRSQRGQLGPQTSLRLARCLEGRSRLSKPCLVRLSLSRNVGSQPVGLLRL